MKLSKILYRTLRRLHLHGVFYNALYRWFSSKVPVDATAVSAAEQRLQALYPDKGQSSLCFNEEVVPHECDLQVIIPVYNAEQYIVRCVDSVLSQHTTYSFRVVIVDDGSDDGTPELLSAYADHPWVTVISQSNKGHSGARNAALARLIGRYVMFVDADDKLAQGAIESLMSQAYGCDADIVEGAYSRVCEKRTLGVYRHADHIPPTWKDLYGYPFGKVFRSSLFAHVQFPLNYLFEDTVCSYLIYPNSSRVVTINDIVYEYTIHLASVTHSTKGKSSLIDALWVTRRMLADSDAFGVEFGVDFYEMFLRDLRVNFMRFITLPDRSIHRNAFIVSCHLLRSYFDGFRTTDPELLPLEQALLSADYGAYLFYGHCYLCE